MIRITPTSTNLWHPRWSTSCSWRMIFYDILDDTIIFVCFIEMFWLCVLCCFTSVCVCFVPLCFTVLARIPTHFTIHYQKIVCMRKTANATYSALAGVAWPRNQLTLSKCVRAATSWVACQVVGRLICLLTLRRPSVTVSELVMISPPASKTAADATQRQRGSPTYARTHDSRISLLLSAAAAGASVPRLI